MVSIFVLLDLLSCICSLLDTKCLLPCRVKELGPGGPVEGKPAEIALPNNINFGAMSPQNSDLAKLKTSNVRTNSTLVRGKQTLILIKKNLMSIILYLHYMKVLHIYRDYLGNTWFCPLFTARWDSRWAADIPRSCQSHPGDGGGDHWRPQISHRGLSGFFFYNEHYIGGVNA